MFFKRTLLICLLWSALSLAMAQVRFTEQLVREANPQFGGSIDRPVTLSDDYAFMASPSLTTGGKVYVFKFNAATNYWDEQATLVSPDGGRQDHFGSSLAVSGDWLIVGAERFGTQLQGKIYFFKKDGNGNWGPTPRFQFEGLGPMLGQSVDIEGDRAIAGGYDATRVGQALTFKQVNGIWQFDGQLVPTTGRGGALTPENRYGFSVAIEGGAAIVGAPSSNPSVQSKAWFFKADPYGNWSGSELLTSHTASEFGAAVDLSAGRIAIGVPNREGTNDEPLLHIFEQNASGWFVSQTLAGKLASRFGESVVLKDDRLLVGASTWDGDGQFGRAAYYQWQEDYFELAEHLSTDLAHQGDRFGRAVALSSKRAFVSAPFWQSEGITLGAGFAYRTVSLSEPISDPQGTPGDSLGYPFVASGEHALTRVGEFSETGSQPGQLVFFKKSLTGKWQVTQRIADPAGTEGYSFSIAISGRYAAVAFSDTFPVNTKGHLYIYEYKARRSRGEAPWQLVYKESSLHIQHPQIAMEGDLLVMGLPRYDDARGRVDAYHLSMGSWAPIGSLPRTGGKPDERFGTNLAINSSKIIVGTDFAFNQGSVHTYSRVMLSGSPILLEGPSLVPPADSQTFALSMSINDGVYLIGARNKAYLYSWYDPRAPIRTVESDFISFGVNVAVLSENTFAVADLEKTTLYHFDEVIPIKPDNTGYTLATGLVFNGETLMISNPTHDNGKGAFFTFENHD